MLFRYPFVAMGTGCEFLIEGDHQAKVLSTIRTALSELTRLEQKYSLYKEDSFLSAINREAHRAAVTLDPETARLLDAAGEIHARTAGRFDPTVGTLHKLWNFQRMSIPRNREIQAALEGAGWRNIQIAQGAIRLLHPATRLDFGGLVKEYAVDCATAVLQGMGVRRGLVNLGGDLRVVGRLAPGERPFRVGVAHPRRHHGTVCTLRLSEGAVVTSGDYQRYFFRDGVRYHHLLDPRTGYPMALAYSGATAHAPTALQAMARAKSLILTGDPDSSDDPRDGAYLACDAEGEPSAWRESAACAFSICVYSPAIEAARNAPLLLQPSDTVA